MANIKIERGLNLGVAYTPDMQDGGKRPEPTWSGIRDQVREADALGYDTILAVETQHDPYLELAIAAQEPSKIELATGIALAYTKSPVATAYTAWDLQRMSGGRLNLGLGSQVKGHVTRHFGMPWSKPAQRMKDYVGAMRACWRTWQTKEPLNYQSEHYNLSLMTPNFAPPPVTTPHIPVLIAAVQERMLQVAGEVCDGVRLHGIVTRKYLDQIAFPNLKKGFDKSGKPAAEWSNFQIDGWGDTADQLHKLSVQQKWPEMAKLVTDEMVHAFAAVGTYDEIAGVIKKRFAGVNRLSFDMPVKNDHDRGVLKEILQELKHP